MRKETYGARRETESPVREKEEEGRRKRFSRAYHPVRVTKGNGKTRVRGRNIAKCRKEGERESKERRGDKRREKEREKEYIVHIAVPVA